VHLLFVGARRVKIVEVLPRCMTELNVECTRHTSVKICVCEELTVCTGKHLICSATGASVYTVNVLICEHDGRPKSLKSHVTNV
jgi:hypothetical protein